MNQIVRTIFNRCYIVLPGLLVLLVSLIAMLIPDGFNHTNIAIYFSDLVGKQKNSALTTYPRPNGFDVNTLVKGDILLLGYPNCDYGYYSHTAMYVGDKRTVEGYLDQGVCLLSVYRLKQYSRICVLRVKADQKIREAAADYALQQVGKPSFIAFKPGERYWSCSKLLWKAYYSQGVDLDENHSVMPNADFFPESPNVRIVYIEGD